MPWSPLRTIGFSLLSWRIVAQVLRSGGGGGGTLSGMWQWESVGEEQDGGSCFGGGDGDEGGLRLEWINGWRTLCGHFIGYTCNAIQLDINGINPMCPCSVVALLYVNRWTKYDAHLSIWYRTNYTLKDRVWLRYIVQVYLIKSVGLSWLIDTNLLHNYYFLLIKMTCNRLFGKCKDPTWPDAELS